MKHRVYRHFDANGVLLYVGVSLNVSARLAEHKLYSHWFDDIVRITLEPFDTRIEALEAERKAIETENPAFNVRFGKIPHAKLSPIIKQLQAEQRSLKRLAADQVSGK